VQRNLYRENTQIVSKETDIAELAASMSQTEVGAVAYQLISSAKELGTWNNGVFTPKRSATQDQFKNYLRDGQNLSRLFCMDFLSELGNANARHEYRRKWVVLLAGLSEAIIGLTSADGTTAVLTALGFTNIMTAMDDYQEFAFLAQDQQALKALVSNAQEAVAKSHSGSDAPTSFGATVVALKQFEIQCSRDGIRNLIMASVKKVAPGEIRFDKRTGQLTMDSLVNDAKSAGELRLRLRAEKRAAIVKDLEDMANKNQQSQSIKNVRKEVDDTGSQETTKLAEYEAAASSADAAEAKAAALLATEKASAGITGTAGTMAPEASPAAPKPAVTTQ
jgi:hypothetical protein